MKASKHAFSLVELLVVIAVIGAIAAIAIPALTGVLGRGEDAKTTRNAQQVVSTYAMAKAAGATFTSLDLRGKIGELIGGKRGAGRMASTFFSIGRLEAEEVTAVITKIDFDPVTDSLRLSLRD